MVIIKTYQDLLEVGEDEKERADFVLAVMNDHKASKEYKDALVAQDYYEGVNTTITSYNKFIRDAFGKEIPDVWFSNNYTSFSDFKVSFTQLPQKDAEALGSYANDC